jgi:hypothetical protein
LHQLGEAVQESRYVVDLHGKDIIEAGFFDRTHLAEDLGGARISVAVHGDYYIPFEHADPYGTAIAATLTGINRPAFGRLAQP